MAMVVAYSKTAGTYLDYEYITQLHVIAFAYIATLLVKSTSTKIVLTSDINVPQHDNESRTQRRGCT